MNNNAAWRVRWFLIAAICVWAWFRVPEAAGEGWRQNALYAILAVVAMIGLYLGVKGARGVGEPEAADLVDKKD